MTATPGAGDVVVTDADQLQARARVQASTRGVVPLSIAVAVAVILVCGVFVTSLRPGLAGMTLVLWLCVVTVAVLTPLVLVIYTLASSRGRRDLALSFASERHAADDARRREFETRLANALEMADDEAKVMSTVGRALLAVLPESRVEILLADNSLAHLDRVLVSGSTDPGAGCRVESPDRCAAARRGQTQVFADSDELDACPHLQGRSLGRCAAVCVPVSIMGRTVGVVHRTDPWPVELHGTTTRQLEVIANQMGVRVGMLRVMLESQLHASTDQLTGLPNRRVFERRVRELSHVGEPFVMVLADLDSFKQLNDTYGHATGDRALRVYSTVLREGLRVEDVVCRHGGEEFAFVLPRTNATLAAATCERLRVALVSATQAAGLPRFTASYGIANWTDDLTYDALVAAADEALYQAKHDGRDQVAVVANPPAVS